MSEDLKIARQWLAKAMNDLLNADNNLKSEQIPFDTVCFPVSYTHLTLPTTPYV